MLLLLQQENVGAEAAMVDAVDRSNQETENGFFIVMNGASSPCSWLFWLVDAPMLPKALDSWAVSK